MGATKSIFLLLVNIIVSLAVFSQKNIRLTSPDGNISFELIIDRGLPFYTINYKKQNLISRSALGTGLKNLEEPLAFYFSKSPSFSANTETYNLIVGKSSKVVHSYKKAVFFFNAEKNDFSFHLEVKAFNDGIAFRYLFPQQKKFSDLILIDELTTFNISGNPLVKALLLPGYTTSHEGLYTTTSYSRLKEDTLIDMPALFQFPGNIYMAITEAALLNYAGMYLVKQKGILQTRLSPLPSPAGDGIIKVKARFPHQSPWRVLLISARPGTLIESNIITTLNSPSKIKDWNWLKPGTTTFPWWNGTIVPDSIKGGNNFETNKYYIDFCAANNIMYHTVVEYGGHEWYTNDGEWYQPGKNFDITKPVDGLDMKQICDYGKSKGVGIRVWTHWKALYPKLDTAFSLFEKWGISGLMVDFMDRDDQEMVNIQTEILEKAAKHKLHIQFHGAYKPTGLHRTYPNELTREGAMNYEYHKWDKLITPEADLNIVFTRMLAGPVDYHMGGFRALPVDKFYPQNIKPYVMGTRCHMLAMYIVLENYLPMLADEPDAYINQPGFEAIKKIPGTWDETKVLVAELDKYISIARRKADTWYIGTITGNKGNEPVIKLDFLSAGKYAAEIYSDAPDANVNADNITKQLKTVDRNTVMKLTLADGGGHLIILKKLN